jgi:3-hydroxyisobutyrate dehydrogenase-like beta-hydroxyacid dehydrogenase
MRSRSGRRSAHPDTCRRLAARAAVRGVRLIDAPVSGGGPAAEAGRLLVMAGGEEAVDGTAHRRAAAGADGTTGAAVFARPPRAACRLGRRS